MKFLVSKTYSYIRFVGEEGDYDEAHGWVDRGSLMSLRQVVNELDGYSEASCCPLTADSCGGTWFSRYLDCYECDQAEEGGWEGGEEALHIKRADGTELSSRALFRIYRLAGKVS
jgi:hypothetical protein